VVVVVETQEWYSRSVIPLSEVLGESPGLKAVREQIRQILERRSTSRRLPPILIQGETGTGKGLVAHAIHRAGPRASGPFVHVNCAAIPENLLEAELFGFERGAFTDAKQAKAGLFQAAHRGTLFLDEVGLLPEGLQGKLLTAVEQQAVRRLGSTRADPVDVWILAAHSEDLKIAVRARRFREDLYHRLALLTVSLPPLRERGRNDILLLAEHFMARACADYGLPPKALAPEARAALAVYPWPGNVRELANVIERVALLSDQSEVTAEMLALPRGMPADVTVKHVAEGVEPEQLLAALRQTEWNVSRAAARLGISRNTLRYRMEKHGLDPEVSTALQRRVERLDAPAAPKQAANGPRAAEPAVVRWERRRLAVLRLVLTAPDEELLSDTGHALEEAMDKVRVFGGRVEELSPAAVVASFGIEPLEDAAQRAALAAKAILKATQRSRGASGAPVAAKLGIHVTQLLIGKVGAIAQIDLQGKREAWTILDSLTEGAEAHAIMVSSAAAPFLERRFELLPPGADKPWPQGVYRLSGRERAESWESLAGFVGRQQEIELVRGRYESASRGHGQVIGVVGEPGIGKSRLLREFRQGLAGQRVTYLEGRCVSYGCTIPYLPLLDVLRSSCGITDADGPEVIAEKAGAALGGLGMTPSEGLPYLLHLLGLHEGSRALAGLEPDVIKTRLLEILRRMMLRLSERDALIVAVEDLHWSDKSSEDYFASLVDAVAGARVLLVFSYRPGYRPPWISKSFATQIALQPLAPRESESIVRAVLGDRAPASLVEVILAKGAGNPFFLEELARTVHEHDSPVPSMPDTVQEAIAARINLLEPQAKRLLQAAAVIGPEVPAMLLGHVADLPEADVRQGLLELRAAEIFHEKAGAAEPAYSFKHALIQEAVCEGLQAEQRRALHARVVEAIERLHAGRLGEQIERLAHHAFNAQAWGKAVAYLRQAGAKAAGRSAHLEAAACYEQALVALAHLPECRERTEQAIDVRFELRTSLHLLGEFDRILEHLRQAQALAESLDARSRSGWVSSYLMQYFRHTGDQASALEAGRRALAIAQDLGDFALQVTTHTHLGVVYGTLGQYRRAVEILRGNVQSLAGPRGRERFGMVGLPAVLSSGFLAWYLAELGEFPEASARSEEALAIAESANDPYSLAIASNLAGVVAVLDGAPAQAIHTLERALELCRAMGFRILLPSASCWLGAAYTLAGRSADAVPLIKQAVEAAVSMKRMDRYAIFLVQLGEAHVHAGRPDWAREPAERALQLARRQGERGHEAYALRLLADIASRDHVDERKAQTGYREARALAEQLGMRPLVAHCHLGLGRLYRRAENPTRAAAPFEAAAVLYREMDMRHWLAQVEAETRSALPSRG
jgi:DNA-binding NtrC family response regulator/tetratricopeptide (TPR) repeat protein